MKQLSILLVVAILFSGCAYNSFDEMEEIPAPINPNATYQKHTVTASGMVFTPSSLTINVGDTVVFDNVSGFHNVNGTQATFPTNPASFDNGAVATAPWTFTFVFTIVGNYNYQCDAHAPGMAGTITVQ